MALLFEVDRRTALALASVAVSLRVTQVVNETWGVHAFWQTGRSSKQRLLTPEGFEEESSDTSHGDDGDG